VSLKKRSVTLYGHQTSVALEPEFWAIIDAHIKTKEQSFAGFIRDQDDLRLANHLGRNLGSHLNSRNTLFGGRLLEWIDEECGVYAACQMHTQTLVTKSMTELNFLAPARQGDVVEIGVETVDVSHCTITVGCHVRIKHTKQEIVSIDKIVFVNVDDNGRPVRHGQYKAKPL